MMRHPVQSQKKQKLSGSELVGKKASPIKKPRRVDAFYRECLKFEGQHERDLMDAYDSLKLPSDESLQIDDELIQKKLEEFSSQYLRATLSGIGSLADPTNLARPIYNPFANAVQEDMDLQSSGLSKHRRASTQTVSSKQDLTRNRKSSVVGDSRLNTSRYGKEKNPIVAETNRDFLHNLIHSPESYITEGKRAENIPFYRVIFEIMYQIEACQDKEELVSVLTQSSFSPRLQESLSKSEDSLPSVRQVLRKPETIAKMQVLLGNFVKANQDKVKQYSVETKTDDADSMSFVLDNKMPFVFLKHAFLSELLGISRQVSLLAGGHDKGRMRRVDLLASELDKKYHNNRTTLSKALQNKMEKVEGYVASGSNQSLPVNDDYEQRLRSPERSIRAQLNCLLRGGKMNIALSNPATRSYDLEEVLSENQLDNWLFIRRAIAGTKGGIGGYAKIVDETAAGKSFLIKVAKKEIDKQNAAAEETMADEASVVTPTRKYALNPSKLKVTPNASHTPPHLAHGPNTPMSAPRPALRKNKKSAIDIDLNTTSSELEALLSQERLDGKVIFFDEAFFGSRLFLDGVVSVPTGENVQDLSMQEMEVIRNDFLYGFRKKGACVNTFGASESPELMALQIQKLGHKITERRTILERAEYQDLIREATPFLYSVHKNVRQAAPVFSSVFRYGEEESAHNTIARASDWGKEATVLARSKVKNHKGKEEDVITPVPIAIGFPKKKKGKIVTDDQGKIVFGARAPITNKEYLVRTAFYIRELADKLGPIGIRGNRELGIERCQELEDLEQALIPEHRRSNCIWDVKNSKLEDYLALVNIGEDANKKRKYSSQYKFNLANLCEAVHNFLSPDLQLYSQLPVDDLQKHVSSKKSIEQAKEEIEELEQNKEIKQVKLTNLETRIERTWNRLKDKENTRLFLDNTEEPLENRILDRLSPVEDKHKVQYIMPDFRHMENLFGNPAFVHDIFNKTAVDMLILNVQDGKSLKALVIKRDAAGELIKTICGFSDEDALPLENFLGNVDDKKIISFFDYRNAIGGDYKGAGLGVKKQIWHFTQDDFLLLEHSGKTIQHFLQYDRNRTLLSQRGTVSLDIVMPDTTRISSSQIEANNIKESEEQDIASFMIAYFPKDFTNGEAVPDLFVKVVKSNTEEIDGKIRPRAYILSKRNRGKILPTELTKNYGSFEESISSEDGSVVGEEDEERVRTNLSMEHEEDPEIEPLEVTAVEENLDDYGGVPDLTTMQRRQSIIINLDEENDFEDDEIPERVEVDVQESLEDEQFFPPNPPFSNGEEKNDEDVAGKELVAVAADRRYPLQEGGSSYNGVVEVEVEIVREKEKKGGKSIPRYRFDLTVESKESDEEKPASPSPSMKPVAVENRSGMQFEKYEFTISEDSQRYQYKSDQEIATHGNGGNYFMVAKGVYENVADMANTIFSIVIGLASHCNLHSSDLLEALDISRKEGGFKNQGSRDDEKWKKYSKFSSKYQQTCASCGIYSLNLQGQGLKMVGTPSSDLPKTIYDQLTENINKYIESGCVYEEGSKKYRESGCSDSRPSANLDEMQKLFESKRTLKNKMSLVEAIKAQKDVEVTASR